MRSPTKPTQTTDDRLADFTDRLMEGKTAVLASSADLELRKLEETAMLIDRSFPKDAVDEKVLRRMLNQHKLRVRRAESSSPPLWRSQQSRTRSILIAAVIIVLLGISIAVPFLASGNGNVEGTAGLQSQNTIPFIILGSVIFLLIWVGRRK
jgi:hypothetical protein